MIISFPRGFSNILKNNNFLKLWISQIFSMSACNMLTFLLAIRIYQLTENNFIVSIYVALVSIPPIIFSIIAGAFADNHNRKKILTFSNLFRVLLLVAFLFLNKNPFALMVLAFLVSTISQFFGPAESATIPNLVKKDQLFLANSLFMFTTYAAFLIGYSLAGPLLFHLTDRLVFSLLLVMYSVAMVANILLPSQKHHLEVKKKTFQYGNALKKLFHDILDGWRAIKNNKVILYSILQMTFILAVERGVIALLPDLAKKYFQYNTDEISYYLLIPVGLGALTGAILINKVKKYFPKRKIINWSLIIDGLVLLAIPFYYVVLPWGGHWLKLATSAFAFASGMADVFIIITAQTLIHESSLNEERGRIFGNLMAFMNIISVPLILLLGFIGSFYNPTVIIGVLGVIVTSFGIMCRFFYKRSLRLAKT